ncbi:TetR/AcrR family transcriptional regulator [Actinopolyspora mortivallis]|uniref:TetR family transcriptional regulator n=1 Tax=Actinopolyspora mortivallis TaxID=33906 RepID=A0A2T0H283_ACTMO|nr:TetR/AcrR family transcriptional regulator [Actinopolyspora mortivallis]PRW65363.1 TetR family transcriptional regulator [Actinopolyspora mortivallis]
MFENQSTPQAPARPTPVQRRGIERVRAILDAAETLLGEQGYEAATLKAIGERAGIPTASVYHYFSDRTQVDAELLRRHLHEVEQRLTTALSQSAPRTLREAIDTVIDPMIAYFREYPSCVELWFTGRHQALSELVRAFDEAQAEQLRHVLVERGLLPADTPPFVLRFAFEAGRRLFDVAFRYSPSGDDVTIDETRRLVNAYLETYARPTPEEHD